MTDIRTWSIELILWLQQFSPTLDPFFLVLTSLGDETFFLLFLPLIYWCIDRRVGARLVMLFLVSTYLSVFLELLADQPRPFHVDRRVRALVAAESGGFPSTHTQSITVVWGYLARSYRRRWLWWLAIVLSILVPCSRLYLGVHFPIDLLGGYVIGVLLLFFFLRWAPKSEQWLASRSLLAQLLVAILAPLLLVFLLPAPDDAGVASAGTLLGMGVGFTLAHRWVHFAVGAAWLQRLLRYLAGVIPLVLLYIGLRAAFAGLEPEPVWRFVRYGLLGSWVALGAPWLFVRIRLAETKGELFHAHP